MSIKDCKDHIQREYGLDDEAAEDIISRLQDAQRAAGAARDIAIALKRAGKEAGEEAQRDAINAKIEEQKTLLAIIRGKEFVLQGEGRGLYNKMEQFLVGRTGDESFGAMKSIDAEQKMLWQKLSGGAINDLKRVNDMNESQVARMMENKDMNDDVAREMVAFKTGERATGNDVAFNAAKVFEKWNEVSRKLANDEGANIAFLPGYVRAQHHDARLVFKAKFDKWFSRIYPRVDKELSFKGTENHTKVMREIYLNITTGRKAIVPGTAGRKGGNLGERMGRERVLHFKSADDWLAYNEEFSGKTIIPGIFAGYESIGHDIGLMRGLSTQPERVYKEVKAAMLDKFRKTDLAPPVGREQRLDKQFEVVSRLDVIPGDATIARFIQALKSIQNMSKLGQATLSSVTDPGFAVAAARHNGVGYLEAHAAMFGAAFKGKAKGEAAVIARQLGVGVDGLLGAIARRMMATDGPPGLLSNLNNQFFKWNGLAWWTDVMKEGFAMMMSHHIARQVKLPFDKLNINLQKTFTQYGIGPGEWDSIRAAGVQQVDGKAYLTPEMVSDTKISDAFRSYFISESDIAVPTPGARERAFVTQGLQRGTVAGGVAELFAQFKMFPTTVITKHWPRLKRMGVPGSIYSASLVTLLGYGALTLKDIVNGKEPRDPFSPETFGASMLQGGGMGIVGDLLFADSNGYGRGLTEVLVGPTFGATQDLKRIFDATVRGDDAKARALRLALNNTPYINMFYTRQAINYLFVYHLQEMANPGFLRRMEHNLKARTGQEYISPPSRTIQRGGGFQ